MVGATGALPESPFELVPASDFLDAADGKHPDLKGLSPDDRAAISRRLHDASKGR